MNPYHVLQRAYERGGTMDLTPAEAQSLQPHLDLLHDLHLLLPGPSAQLRLSALGAGLMARLEEQDNLEDRDKLELPPAPGM